MKRSKIVLYNPKAVFYTMPLALIAIGSQLDPRKYEVKIIDGRLEKDPAKTVLAEIDDALCLGITVLTGNPIRDALRISRAAKSQRSDLPVIWGGWHPSLFPTKTLEDEASIDITVQGQGEETFRELIGHLTEQNDLSAVKGISYCSKGEVIQNPPRSLMDMNELQAANYDLIQTEDYFKLKGKRQLDYISSTGCYFRCAFCADPFVYDRKWTGLQPERMGAELEYLKKNYEFDDIDFQDETFFTYRKRALGIAGQFIQRSIESTWAGTMRADQGSRLSEEDLALCAKSGLRRLLIGVESGSQKMLDWMKKDIKIGQILENAERCRRHGIAVIFPFIVGFPGESDEFVWETLDMVKKLRAMSPDFDTPIFYYKPYPGSKITRDVVKNGYSLPDTLDEWTNFDYIGSSGPWVSKKKYKMIERFKFYSRIAGGHQKWFYMPLHKLAGWRCNNDFYKLPIEKIIIERLKPLPKLS